MFSWEICKIFKNIYFLQHTSGGYFWRNKRNILVWSTEAEKLKRSQREFLSEQSSPLFPTHFNP